MKKSVKKQMDVAANRKATLVIMTLSIAIVCVMKKYGKEKKN